MFEAKKAVNGRLKNHISNLKFVLIFFHVISGDFYFSAPVRLTRLSRSKSRIVAPRMKLDGAFFDTLFRQILGMESEIFWESEITPTLVH
jgi:hypothetical protein